MCTELLFRAFQFTQNCTIWKMKCKYVQVIHLYICAHWCSLAHNLCVVWVHHMHLLCSSMSKCTEINSLANLCEPILNFMFIIGWNVYRVCFPCVCEYSALIGDVSLRWNLSNLKLGANVRTFMTDPIYSFDISTQTDIANHSLHPGWRVFTVV